MSGRLLKHVTWLVDSEMDPEEDEESSFFSLQLENNTTVFDLQIDYSSEFFHSLIMG